MIIRISSEGQYRIDSSYLDQLNTLDNEIVTAIAGGDRERYAALLRDLLSLVRDHGTRLGDDELLESQVVLPAPDTTFDEAVELFVDEGLIPELR